MASVLCKIVENNALAGLSTDVFHMAAVGGTNAFGRSDFGRLVPSCRADIDLVRIDTPKATPVYDPFKFIIHAATGDDVDRFIVDGTTIANDGEELTIDVPKVIREGNNARARVWVRLDL